MPSSLVTIAAHPDDCSIFWGGTVAKHVAEGWRVISVTVDDGRGSPHSFEMSAEELVRVRADEVRRESLRLGAEHVHFGLPGLKTPATRAECHRRLVELLGAARPARVITHHLADKHPTHQLVARAVCQALVAVEQWPEVWCADGWEPVHEPDVRVDVTPWMNLKMAAVGQHSSQLFDTPYVMGAWGLALYRAGFAASHEVTDPACVFAEAFRTLSPAELRAAAAGE